jgi:hypothetical protein
MHPQHFKHYFLCHTLMVIITGIHDYIKLQQNYVRY